MVGRDRRGAVFTTKFRRSGTHAARVLVSATRRNDFNQPHYNLAARPSLIAHHIESGKQEFREKRAVASAVSAEALRATISGADYCFCAAAFCSPRLCRGDFAFACLALPRRHCSTTSTALGREPECLVDQLLGCVLSLIHGSAVLLGRLSISIRPDRYGLRRHSRLGRPGDDALGKPTARTLLHSKPLARAFHHVGDRCTFRLRLVARHALRQQCSWRSALADHRLRDSAFPGSRCRIDRLLSRVLPWSASATHAARTTAIQLK